MTLQQPTVAVPIAVSYDATTKTVTLHPTETLAAGTPYTARINGGASGTKDAAGNPLAADRVWTFTTLCATGPFVGQYYNNRTPSGNPSFTRCGGSPSSPINDTWPAGQGSGNGLGTDNVSIRWTGSFNFTPR